MKRYLCIAFDEYDTSNGIDQFKASFSDLDEAYALVDHIFKTARRSESYNFVQIWDTYENRVREWHRPVLRPTELIVTDWQNIEGTEDAVPSMQLWTISIGGGYRAGYDMYDSAIVAAETAEQARLTHPQDEDSIRWINGSWSDVDQNRWVEPGIVDVELIGTAAPYTKAGVILASFNRG